MTISYNDQLEICKKDEEIYYRRSDPSDAISRLTPFVKGYTKELQLTVLAHASPLYYIMTTI